MATNQDRVHEKYANGKETLELYSREQAV